MINVYPIIFDNASFLELQYLSFKKNFPIQRFNVIDNAPNEAVRADIHTFAARHDDCGVIRVPNPRFDNAGFSHQIALQCAVDNMQGVAIICDPDIFILREFMGDMGEYVFAGLMQGTEKVRYIWPGFMMIATQALKGPLDLRGVLINPDNFDDYIIADTAAGWLWSDYHEQLKTRIPIDSGGLLCRYIKEHSPNIKEFSLAFMGDMCYDTSVMPEHLRHLYSDLFNFWIIAGSVLHSGRLSNWDHRPYDEVVAKSELVREIVRHYIDT